MSERMETLLWGDLWHGEFQIDAKPKSIEGVILPSFCLFVFACWCSTQGTMSSEEFLHVQIWEVHLWGHDYFLGNHPRLETFTVSFSVLCGHQNTHWLYTDNIFLMLTPATLKRGVGAKKAVNRVSSNVRWESGCGSSLVTTLSLFSKT